MMRGTSSASTYSSLMILLIVAATAVPKVKAATKLKNAAKATARRGVRTLVETTVAMALAESWNPLVKSKIKAMKMMMMMTRISDGVIPAVS